MFHALFHKKKKYIMDMETANQTLQNVFASCETPPNTIPFDKLVLRRQAHTKTLQCMTLFSFLSLLFVLLLPLAFCNFAPQFEIRSEVNSDIQVIDGYIKGERFYLCVTGSDLDLGDSYIAFLDGSQSLSVYYDNTTGEIVFPYPGGEVTIFVSNGDGDYLKMILTPEN
ncbi:MAG: hypothetical protein PHE02_08950 [Lachnospiraceae bacterium]|nr:hypothetical protein [Lachnospiraceae bacterium]